MSRTQNRRTTRRRNNGGKPPKTPRKPNVSSIVSKQPDDINIPAGKLGYSDDANWLKLVRYVLMFGFWAFAVYWLREWAAAVGIGTMNLKSLFTKS